MKAMVSALSDSDVNNIARYAAQRVDYLGKVLQAYQTGARKSSAMAAMSEALSDSDVESLAAYYAGKKARAVVFIMLPAN